MTSIFNAGMILQAAAGLPGEVTVRRIAEARRRFVRSACMCPATAGLFPCTQNRRGAVCARSGCFILVQNSVGSILSGADRITVITGGCPCMLDPAADPGHKAMRLVFTLTGAVPRRV